MRIYYSEYWKVGEILEGMDFTEMVMLHETEIVSHRTLYMALTWKFQINECVSPGIAKDSQGNLSAHDTTKVLSYLRSLSLHTEA